MKILVCLSAVPDTASRIRFTKDSKKFDTTGIQFVINPNDEFGLTVALNLKDSHQAEVSVIHVGDNTGEQIIRKALALGVDSAFRIDFVPQSSHDTALLLNDFLQKNPFDLIIMGKESIDYNNGLVPMFLSNLSEFGFINNCSSIEINHSQVKATREINGKKETVSAELPLIIAGEKGLVKEDELRIPNMRGIMSARKKNIEVLAPLNLNDFKKSQTDSYESLPPKPKVRLINKDHLDEVIDVFHNELNII